LQHFGGSIQLQSIDHDGFRVAVLLRHHGQYLHCGMADSAFRDHGFQQFAFVINNLPIEMRRAIISQLGVIPSGELSCRYG